LLLVKTHISEATFIDFLAISSADMSEVISTFAAANA